MIDFIIIRCRDKRDICSTQTMRGAPCGTDHHMLRSMVIFSIIKAQSETRYETRQAEHKQIEKHQSRGETGVGNGQYTCPIMGKE